MPLQLSNGYRSVQPQSRSLGYISGSTPAATSKNDEKHRRQFPWTTTQLRGALARYHRELLAAGNHRPTTITTYVQHPERIIVYLEGTYNPRQPPGRNAGQRATKQA